MMFHLMEKPCSHLQRVAIQNKISSKLANCSGIESLFQHNICTSVCGVHVSKDLTSAVYIVRERFKSRHSCNLKC